MARILILRVILAALILSAPISVSAFAQTTLNYAASDGSFGMDGTLRASSFGKYYMYCVDLGRSVQYAWDPQTQKWNNDVSANQNPATDTGGRSLSGLNAGPYYPAWAGFDANTRITANFGAFTSAQYPSSPSLPSGYSWWGSGTTWNPSDKDAGVTLSNGDLTATGSGFSAVRGTSSITGSQKVCYSGMIGGPSYRQLVGIGNSTMALSAGPGVDANGTACYSSGSFPYWYLNGNTSANCTPVGASDYERTIKSTIALPASSKKCIEFTLNSIYVAGFSPSVSIGVVNGSFPVNGVSVGEDANSAGIAMALLSNIYKNAVDLGDGGQFVQGTTNMIAVDIPNGKIWVYNSTTAKWNDDVIANQNPATNTGGVDIASLGGTLYWAMSYYDLDGLFDLTINFGATAFSNTCPSGFNAQDSGRPSFRTQIIQ